MRVGFFTEASTAVGLGHLRRCAVLAHECRSRGWDVEFFSEDALVAELLPGWMEEPVRVLARPRPDLDWIVWDVRDPQSAEAAKVLRTAGTRLLVLDELGPARRSADVIVDALMTPTRARRAPEAPESRLLYGLDYLVLDETKLRPRLVRAEEESNLAPLIVFGGSDPEGIGELFLEALAATGFTGSFTMVAGLRNPAQAALQRRAAGMGGTVIPYADDLPALMAMASVVVTKLGTTTWEAFALAKPCLLLEPTAAHETLAAELKDHYSNWPAWNFGLATRGSAAAAAAWLVRLTGHPGEITKFARRAGNFVGLEGARRVVDAMADGAELSPDS